jgi:thioredoxin reductase (NADPH)
LKLWIFNFYFPACWQVVLALFNYFIMYELVIIGAGPAGLSASIYASRYGIRNVIIGEISGGLPNEAHEIGNWLGTESITGAEFVQKSIKHARSYGTEIIQAKVDLIEKGETGFTLNLNSGKKIMSKTVLLSMGNKHRKLGVPGEKELVGKGVSYCATCDGFFYRHKTVAVAGGNDSAVQAALFLSDISEKVYLIYRGENLRAENYWVKKIEAKKNIRLILSTNIKEIKGESKIELLVLDNPYENSDILNVDGVFIEIGLAPNTDLARNMNIVQDEEGYIRIDADGKTTEQGIWAAGDITTGSNKLRQIVTAAAEGAIASESISRFLKG